MKEAMEHTAVKNPLSVDELSDQLAAVHADNPQRETKARRALAMLREGLAELASLGHSFHLLESPVEPPLRFPQMLYKAGAPDHLIVDNTEEYDAAKADGWSEQQQPAAQEQTQEAQVPATPPAGSEV